MHILHTASYQVHECMSAGALEKVFNHQLLMIPTFWSDEKSRITEITLSLNGHFLILQITFEHFIIFLSSFILIESHNDLIPDLQIDEVCSRSNCQYVRPKVLLLKRCLYEMRCFVYKSNRKRHDILKIT